MDAEAQARVAVLRELQAINFGHASAEREIGEAALLTEGFLEVKTVDALFAERRFLVLGRKGSGKSALGLHLRARAITQPREFVTSTTAGDLLSVAGDGQQPEATGDEGALRWTMLLHLLASVSLDEGTRSRSHDLNQMLRLLEKEGLLLPAEMLRGPRQKSVRTIRDPILRSFEVTSEAVDEDLTGGLRGALLIGRIADMIAAARSDSRHVLVIDGFEDHAVGRRMCV